MRSAISCLVCATVLVAGEPMPAAEQPGLVAHYAFDEGEGDTPVNVVVERHDERELVMTVNGHGKVKVIPRGRKTVAYELAGHRQLHVRLHD